MPSAKHSKPTPHMVQMALAGISSDKAPVRLGASKTLRLVSQAAPELVYPHFEVFERLLSHPNSVLRWNAILTLGHLAPVDREGKLDRLLNVYLAPIPRPHLIDAANTIRGAALIAAAKPYLANRIAEAILQVECAAYATPECRNVAIGHAIESLRVISDLNGVRDFVTRQLQNPRPATRRKAERFVRDFGGGFSVGAACPY